MDSTLKRRSFPRRFNVESTWCVCREHVVYWVHLILNLFTSGWYAYMEANQRKGSNFPNAHFVSPMYYQGAYNCKFSFWYNMYHYKISVKNDAKLNLLYRRNGKDTQLWTMARTTGNKWVQATVQLPRCPQDFRVNWIFILYFNINLNSPSS